jgi:hypothetical protein
MELKRQKTMDKLLKNRSKVEIRTNKFRQNLS